MSSNNNNNNNNLTDERKKRLEERYLFERFKNVATTRLEAMTRQSEESGIRYEMGPEEKKAFQQLHGMGLKEGMAAGILAFVTLRKGPVYIARWLATRQRRRNGFSTSNHPNSMQQQQQPPYSSPPLGDSTYQLSHPSMTSTTTTTTANPFHNAANSMGSGAGTTGGYSTMTTTMMMNPYFPRSQNRFIRAIWFTFDAMLSLMLGASVSMSYTDPIKMRQQLVELPLLPGRSLTSDALCDDIVRELQMVQKEHNPAYERLIQRMQKQQQHKNTVSSSSSTTNSLPKNNDTAVVFLEGLIAFSENCQRRRYAEQQLRQELSLPPNSPVELHHAISPDAPRLIVTPTTTTNDENHDQVATSTTTMMSDHGMDNSYNDEFSVYDEQWAHGFVDDDDDDNNNNNKNGTGNTNDSNSKK